MRISPSAFLLTVACPLLAYAADIKGHIADAAEAAILPLASDSSVLLDGGMAGRALIRADGSFVLHNVPDGSYVLSVRDRAFAFPNYAVQVASSDVTNPIQVRPYTLGKVSADPSTIPILAYPMTIKPLSRLDYYEIRQGFSLVTMLRQNKMILLMGVGILIAVGLPKLMTLVDPEIMNEVRANQAEMHRNMQSAQNMDVAGSLSKFLAGGDSGSAATGASSSGQSVKRRKAP